MISSAGRPDEQPDPKKPTVLRGAVGVWNCESSDRIKGCDGACIHAVGSLAGADGWSVTNVAAFTFSPTGLTAASLLSQKSLSPRAFSAGIVKDHFREEFPATASSRPTRSLRASETLTLSRDWEPSHPSSGNLTQRAVHEPLTSYAPEVRTRPLCTIQETWRSGSKCRIRAIPELAGRL